MKVLEKISSRYKLYAKRLPERVWVALGSLFLVILTLYIGKASGAFVGFPKGYDSFNHLSLAQIIKENFPHVFWNPYWDGGVVLFPRNYPPLFHFGVGLLAKAFSLEVARVATVVLALSIILTTFFIFLTIFFLTKRVLCGLFSSLFFLASSTVWHYIVVAGLYPRILGMMSLSLVIFSLVLYFSRVKNRRGLKSASLEKGWAYFLVVFSFSLSFLTHFLAAFLASFAFLVLLYFWKGSLQDKLRQALRVFLPVLGLTAFYYLPVLVLRPGKLGFLGSFKGGEYEPWAFLSLFKQGYPGLPFMSLPLGLFVLVVVFLLRYKISKKKKGIYKFFLAFGVLAFFCLLYVLGAYKRFFYGIYPDQFLLPSVFFLSLFLGLGLFFLDAFKVIKKSLFLLLLVGLLAISLAQSPKLKKIAIDQSRFYPKVAFKGIDEARLFRYGHRDEILGGAFNFYSQTLQTRGYYAPGVIHPDFYQWFEEAVFMTPDNSEETKFLLDWYGVKSFYVYSRDLRKEGKTIDVGQKFAKDWENFAKASNYEFEYKRARPVFLATNAPVIIYKKGISKYFELLISLAKEGIDSRNLIPIRSRTAKPEGFSTQVVDSPEEAEDLADEAFDRQIPSFINSQKREIELKEKFSGVLLKESFFGNWRAYLIVGGTGSMNQEAGTRNNESGIRKLPVYFAGPGMMYVSLPKTYTLPAKVVFEYRPSLVEKIGVLISFVSLGLVILYSFNHKLLDSFIHRIIQS